MGRDVRRHFQPQQQLRRPPSHRVAAIPLTRTLCSCLDPLEVWCCDSLTWPILPSTCGWLGNGVALWSCCHQRPLRTLSREGATHWKSKQGHPRKQANESTATQSTGLLCRTAVHSSEQVRLSSPGLALSQDSHSPPAAPCSAKREEARCTLGWAGPHTQRRYICLGPAWLLKAELCRPLEPLAGCAGRSSGGQASAPALSLTLTHAIVITGGSSPRSPGLPRGTMGPPNPSAVVLNRS